MSLLDCPECGKKVPGEARACPECGCPMDYIKAHGKQPDFQYCATSAPDALEAGAALGDPEAMYWLANCLYYGENGFAEDEAEAEKWMRKAAAAGHAQAVTDVQAWFGSPGKAPGAGAAKQELGSLFSRFENLIVFDLETSGLRPEADQIIELAALQVRAENGSAKTVEEFDELIRLPEGKSLPPKITELTHITTETLRRAGKAPESICRQFVKLLVPGKTLMVAYNAQFDMSFLRSFMRKCGAEASFQGLHALDAMTVYKDRRPYPHKLSDAIEAYGLSGVRNSHQAIDDTRSLLGVLLAMDKERDDLEKYIDLFGYNPRWGVNGPQLPGIRYARQPYDSLRRIYE